MAGVTRLPALLLLLLLLPALPLAAEDWPAWRGPRGDGWSAETNAPVEWTRTSNIRWRTPLPEPGNSSPIVWRDTVYVTQALGGRRALVAFARNNGKQRWIAGATVSGRERSDRDNPPAAASPATDGERVVCWFGGAGLFAYDLQGNELWRLDLGRVESAGGYRSSPVLHGDLVFLNFGPGGREFIVAADKRTGREVWRVEAETKGADDLYGTWSTPLVITHDGRAQLLVALRNHFAALEPASGEEIWRSTGHGLHARTSPVAGDGIALLSGDLRGAEIAVQLGGAGNVTVSHRLWRENPPRRRAATGVIVHGHCYGARMDGVLDCITLDEGNEAWAGRPEGPGRYTAIWASPVYLGAAGLIYFVNQGGDTVVIRADPKRLEVVAINPLGETINASPAFSGGQIFLRSHTGLWCVEAAGARGL